MNLVIDQGNTVTKVAIFKSDILVDTFFYETLSIKDCSFLLENYKIEKCIFSTVMKASSEVLEYLNNKLTNFLFIDENTALPIINKYSTPKTLGRDRLAAAVEANALYPDRNVLVIDAGTAITYEFIDDSGAYLGGNISPGIRMRFRALNTFTDKLPLIDRHGELPKIGCDTSTAIRVGVVQGLVFEIRGYIEQYRRESTNIAIVLTGGHAQYIADLLDIEVQTDLYLVLKGLNRILNYNV